MSNPIVRLFKGPDEDEQATLDEFDTLDVDKIMKMLVEENIELLEKHKENMHPKEYAKMMAEAKEYLKNG